VPKPHIKTGVSDRAKLAARKFSPKFIEQIRSFECSGPRFAFRRPSRDGNRERKRGLSCGEITMQCYKCGYEMAFGQTACQQCGWQRSNLIYAPFCAVAGGIVGSLLGFTLFDMIGALLGGLLGIILAEIGARKMLRSGKA
jgi:hypothetical protein